MASTVLHSSRFPRVAGILMFLARPYLRLHLAMYTHTMNAAVFPGDDQEKLVPGEDPDRLLFVGEIGVAGYDVLLPGMAMPAQTAARHAILTHHGCTWETVSAFDMTAQKATTAIQGIAGGVDAAVISMGIPDVLMITSPEQWQAHLATIIDSVRAQAGEQVRIVLTAFPRWTGSSPSHRLPGNSSERRSTG